MLIAIMALFGNNVEVLLANRRGRSQPWLLCKERRYFRIKPYGSLKRMFGLYQVTSNLPMSSDQPLGNSKITSPVQAWRAEVVIPTYGVGEPNLNPMFLEKRVYQGSSGAVYPLAVIDRIRRRQTDYVWQAVFLENEFLKIMILPELGGRVQMAL